MDDTIFALSSGAPPAAIAVVRVSGPRAMAAAEQLAGSLPRPRHASLRRLRDAAGVTLDRALVLCFLGPASATGEDLIEFHLHGGRAVVRAVEAALHATGLRRAMAGEFTRRALRHGRIDLAEAEGLADLLAAETEQQRRVALARAEGVVSRRVAAWRERATMLSAMVEARIDFADEEDGADEDPAPVLDAIGALRDEVAAALAAPTVDRLRDGVRVVLAGPPNAGKSTLLNLLAGRDAAIVSAVAGTTRDRIEVAVAREGAPYVLTDTAGLVRDSDDPIEAIGVGLAEAAIATADILLWLGDGDAPETPASVIPVHARADVREAASQGRIAVARDDARSVAALWQAIASIAKTLMPGEHGSLFDARQHRLCADAESALRDMPGSDWLLIAERLRWCRESLSGIVGHGSTEQMLDALFGRFCIGK